MTELKPLFPGKTHFYSKTVSKVTFRVKKEDSVDFECLVSKKIEKICSDFGIMYLSLYNFLKKKEDCMPVRVSIFFQLHHPI